MTPLERLKKTQKKTVGTKQTIKAVKNNRVEIVFIAKDAEEHVSKPLRKICFEKEIEIVEVENMAELGRACGIEVGSASAAILSN